jgi:hypothetical protein
MYMHGMAGAIKANKGVSVMFTFQKNELSDDMKLVEDRSRRVCASIASFIRLSRHVAILQ